MNWLLTEYLLKGIFLGLLVFASLQQPDWTKTGILAGFLGGGLLLGLIFSLISWIPRGIRVGGRFLSLALFLLLESPSLIYFGLVGGMLAGSLYIRDAEMSQSLLPICVGGGALVGVAIGEARRIGSANARSMAAAAVACILVGLAVYYFESHPTLNRDTASPLRVQFGVHLLMGLPFFYLLTFAGRAEETEAEFAALCGGMAVGVWMINLTPQLPSLALILPAGLYVVYTRNVMPGLRVFKHTLRGHSYASMGKIRPALLALRRALTLDPNNELALAGMARVHGSINPKQIAGDRETLALLDLDLCLNRAGRLLWEPHPSQEKMDEVSHLLDLVADQRPERLPEVEYWRAVADMRRRDVDSAARRLSRLLDADAWSPEEIHSRSAVLFPAWQMALLRSTELAVRAGKPQLAKPGRRMEAIASVEKLLTLNAQDTDAWELKRNLYDGLTKAEYDARRPAVDGEFDPGYTRELGLALLSDPARWRRGAEYLRMTADAVPARAPGLYLQIAQAYEQAGDADEARSYYAMIRTAGQAFGPKNLPDDEKATFFAVVKRLADEAASKNDHREAIVNLKLLTESDRSGLETYRQLSEMHERIGDALGALHYNDLAMVYNAGDPDLIARKDRYYYSVTPDQLRHASESIRNGIDVEYCLKKARQVLTSRNNDLDTIDWALHLTEMASVMRPELIEPKVLAARAWLWKGERDRALQILEDVRENKPAKFAAGADEDAWYRLQQMLGDLYLNDYARPDLAVPCYTEFRESSKSGADTLFKLGQAYEALGNIPRAIGFYEQVTGYTEHPKYYDAQDAIRRLKAG